MPRPIETLPQLYAHALAVEHEGAERYAEFQAWFADHGEDVLAGLCARLAAMERQHYELLLHACQGMELPPVNENAYRWLEEGAPEAPARELLYRIATPRQLLEIALQAERNARRFFGWIARSSRDADVRALARALAHEEAGHVKSMLEALEYRDPALNWEKLIASGVGPGNLTAG